jgi:hypothetical protein
MSKAPETIYLIPGEYDGESEGEQGLMWCEDPAPGLHSYAADAIKYVRADSLPTPCLPPRPPEGEGLPRYGIQWNGPKSPLSVVMDDGYWTPWHLANQKLSPTSAAVPEGIKCSERLPTEDDLKGQLDQSLQIIRDLVEFCERPEIVATIARRAKRLLSGGGY